MRTVRILYSIGVRFAGGGIGNTAYHGVRGLYERGILRRLLCGSFRESEIPHSFIRQLGVVSRILRRLAVNDATGHRISHFHNRLYDRWVCRSLEPCDVFVSWNGFGLEALRRVHRLGALTVVYRASSHPLEQARLLREEGARWGLRVRQNSRAIRRSVDEIDEADYILVPSNFARDSCIANGVDPGRLIQIPFGVDLDFFKPADDLAGTEPFRVLFLGQIGIRKGVPYVIQAWERLGWDDAELWLVGNLQRDFANLFEPYRDLPGLVLPGYVHNPAELFRQSHAFVFPTIEEGSALVVYEAMASGLPVITTPNAGSVISNGADGVIVPIRDADALAAQLEYLRRNPRRRLEIGRAARQTAALYPWKRYRSTLTDELIRINSNIE